jgi:hypothetical protein
MDHIQQSHSEHTDWLRKGPLASHLDAYTRRLTERGYARRTIVGYRACLAHFSQWACRRRRSCARSAARTRVEPRRQPIPTIGRARRNYVQLRPD